VSVGSIPTSGTKSLAILDIAPNAVRREPLDFNDDLCNAACGVLVTRQTGLAILELFQKENANPRRVATPTSTPLTVEVVGDQAGILTLPAASGGGLDVRPSEERVEWWAQHTSKH
jgi:hypothetical protein